MKYLIQISLWIALLFNIGCASVEVGQSKTVVRAEQSIEILANTTVTFLKIEHENRQLVKAKFPKVHEYAEWLRTPVRKVGTSGETIRRYEQLIKSVLEVKDAYKKNRNPENEQRLIQALATAEELLRQIQVNIATLNNQEIYGIR